MVEVVVTVRTLTSAMHSGMFGGAAPDTLIALIQMLASLHDARGNTTIPGLDNSQKWTGAKYTPEDPRTRARPAANVELLGDDVADMVWGAAVDQRVGYRLPSGGRGIGSGPARGREP